MNSSPWAVEISRLTVRFGGFTAVDDISFQVRKGEIFGFLGANGAGKTTTIRVLCGLLIPTSGQATVAGIGFDQGRALIKEKVGYMSQRFTLYNDLTVQENLAFVAALRKLDEMAFKRRQRELFDFIGFTPPVSTLVRDLPGGVKQQVSLAAAMLHDPEIIFLDEPTAGVSPASRERFWALIRRLAADGKTVFVTTHYMDEAERCERVALMRAGRIIALNTPTALKKSSFPEPLYELEPAPSAPTDWLDELRKETTRYLIQPHGIRYHVVVKDAADWKARAPRIGRAAKIRPIEPSLEDVFIRLVEERP